MNEQVAAAEAAKEAWKEAFDSINIDSLLDALRRFGIPDCWI